MKSVDVYDIPEEKKKEVIKYCYDFMNHINRDILNKYEVRVNVFMELLYDFALHNLADYEEYELTNEDLKKVYTYARVMGQNIKAYMDGRNELLAIEEDGVFHFQIKKNLLNEE